MGDGTKLKPGFPVVLMFKVWGFLGNLIMQSFLLHCTEAAVAGSVAGRHKEALSPLFTGRCKGCSECRAICHSSPEDGCHLSCIVTAKRWPMMLGLL